MGRLGLPDRQPIGMKAAHAHAAIRPVECSSGHTSSTTTPSGSTVRLTDWISRVATCTSSSIHTSVGSNRAMKASDTAGAVRLGSEIENGRPIGPRHDRASAVAGVTAREVGVRRVTTARAREVMRQVNRVGLDGVPHDRSSLPFGVPQRSRVPGRRFHRTLVLGPPLLGGSHEPHALPAICAECPHMPLSVQPCGQLTFRPNRSQTVLRLVGLT